MTANDTGTALVARLCSSQLNHPIKDQDVAVRRLDALDIVKLRLPAGDARRRGLQIGLLKGVQPGTINAAIRTIRAFMT